ncbi:hypothetical protein DFH08DRAFT_795715 [Mycena albidolilacea]|uniref:Secreted protein n=1 Tax=Mycena albidolilacea TaxID=1033008 RepID=A0AAD7ATB6_9AGAR|nr:hypothetical protein DFH08DRAFT_795715 [Mycena albidolilacea]
MVFGLAMALASVANSSKSPNCTTIPPNAKDEQGRIEIKASVEYGMSQRSWWMWWSSRIKSPGLAESQPWRIEFCQDKNGEMRIKSWRFVANNEQGRWSSQYTWVTYIKEAHG